MSTFNGFFDEIPYISADRFESKNLEESKLLFLSHCHADHMVGLSCSNNLTIPLYTSEISAVFLKKQYPNIIDIQTLSIECPTELTYWTDDDIEMKLLVTAIRAQHCPGSVMFLFQTHKENILYTGDFRLSKSDFKRFSLLTTQTIDSLYMDSTFLSEKYREFPTLTESTGAICSLINDWLLLNPQHRIVIEMPAQYGIEFLFITIGKRLNEKIFVHPLQWNKYIHLPDMDECISRNEAECRISTKFKFKLEDEITTMKEYSAYVRIIKPSAMFWTYWCKGKPLIQQVNSSEFRVAYSNHSSYSELKDFLEFVKPKRVQLNVVPPKCQHRYAKCLAEIFSSTHLMPDDVLTSSNINENAVEVKFNNIFTNRIFSKGESTTTAALKKKRFPPKRLKL